MALLTGLLAQASAYPISVALSCSVSALLLMLFGWLKSQKSNAPNPFATDDRKPRRPLVTDQSLRDKVLKQGFAQKRLPSDLDAIVIGSGIGGLASAALLAKAGKKVLVLEQHDQAGGCCHTFIEKGYEFDVGVHYVGKLMSSSHDRTFIEQISEGQIKFIPIDDNFDTVILGEGDKKRSIPLKSGSREIYRQSLIDAFPDEEEAIDKFMAMLKRGRSSFYGYALMKMFPYWLAKIMWSTGIVNYLTGYGSLYKITTQQFLDSITDNIELKALLSYCYGDYGVSPANSCILMQTSLVNHFIPGASYPEGGASEIAFHIIPVIEATGGKVLVRARVSNILFKGGQAVGVRVIKGGEEHDIYAPIVISNAGAMNTLQMVPKEIALKSRIGDLLQRRVVNNGCGAMSLFVGLKGSSEELELKAQNIWAFTEFDLSESFSRYINSNPSSTDVQPVPLLFIGFPSAKDPTHEDRYPGKSTCTVITMANWQWFEEWKQRQVKKRGDDYEALKDALGQQMWKQVLGLYPQLEDKVEYFEVASPLSNNYYLGADKGEIYGLDHDAKRFEPEVCMKLRPDIGIPGLYLTGQDVMTCGVTGALYGGLATASDVLGRNLYSDCQKLHDKLVKEEAATAKQE